MEMRDRQIDSDVGADLYNSIVSLRVLLVYFVFIYLFFFWVVWRNWHNREQQHKVLCVHFEAGGGVCPCAAKPTWLQ